MRAPIGRVRHDRVEPACAGVPADDVGGPPDRRCGLIRARRRQPARERRGGAQNLVELADAVPAPEQVDGPAQRRGGRVVKRARQRGRSVRAG